MVCNILALLRFLVGDRTSYHRMQISSSCIIVEQFWLGQAHGFVAFEMYRAIGAKPCCDLNSQISFVQQAQILLHWTGCPLWKIDNSLTWMFGVRSGTGQ